MNFQVHMIQERSNKPSGFQDVTKLVDILISKNQMLQVLYLNHHVYKTS